ncbi:hypothetical protein AACH06_29240 [Ideonella sp. DXS29W]|uniref:Uncharacterized protein n=1 Tax=Ideonella lacteola TaxID=2984193 RepID=A0ABU9C1G8_9BURK
MQFARVGDFLAASQITGPRHNLLQLRLGSQPQGVPVCECLPPVGKCQHEPLDKSELIANVLQGVSEANSRHGARHSVLHIRYVENDTKPESVYAFLALKLVEHLEVGGEFTEANNE